MILRRKYSILLFIFTDLRVHLDLRGIPVIPQSQSSSVTRSPGPGAVGLLPVRSLALCSYSGEATDRGYESRRFLAPWTGGTGFLVNTNRDSPTVTGASHLEEPHFSLNPQIFRHRFARFVFQPHRDTPTMSRLTLALTLVIANVCATLSAPVTYDQQQTGDLNVQVHLKDIQIVALLDSSYLGEYGVNFIRDKYTCTVKHVGWQQTDFSLFQDYDYAYDYSDFTIKPITPHATTAKPAAPSTTSTTSVEPWHSWPTISGPTSSSPAPNIAVGEANNATDDDRVTVESSSQLSTATKTGDKESEKVSAPSERPQVASSSVATPEASLKLRATIPESGSIADDKDDDDNVDLTDESDKKDEKDEIVAVPASDQPQESVSLTELSPSSVESAVPEAIQAPTDQPEAQPTRKCSTGYTRDQKGRCRRTHMRRRVPSSLLP